MIDAWRTSTIPILLHYYIVTFLPTQHLTFYSSSVAMYQLWSTTTTNYLEERIKIHVTLVRFLVAQTNVILYTKLQHSRDKHTCGPTSY